jgi:hypothetical protein
VRHAEGEGDGHTIDQMAPPDRDRGRRRHPDGVGDLAAVDPIGSAMSRKSDMRPI